MSENPGTQRLLIVDDSKVIRVTARKILQNHFTTVEALDGNDAWQKLESEAPFALVVSDLTMPGMDGFELLRKIRHSQQPHISELPVIIITGANDSEATMQRARDAGATDFIGKPFDAVHLLARTQSHCNAYLKRQSLTQQNFSMEDQVRRDPATGLANEAALMEQGFQLLSHAIRHHTGFAVAQIEIDGYDRIFRDHGERMAEIVVKYAAGVLQSSIRGEDMVARTGPARFALLLSGMHPDAIHHLTNRISADIRKRSIKSGSAEIRFTVSIGVCAPEITPDARFENLLQTARDNLRNAIGKGGDAVESGDLQAPETFRYPDEPHAGAQPATAEPDATATAPEFDAGTVDEEIELTVLEMPAMDAVPEMADSDIAAARSTAARVSAQPAPAVAMQATTPFPDDIAAMEEDEIVITAPFSIFDSHMETVQETDTTATGEAAAAVADEGQQPEQAPGRTRTSRPSGGLLATQEAVEEDGDEAAPRRGILGRLLGVFSRRKPSHD